MVDKTKLIPIAIISGIGIAVLYLNFYNGDMKKNEHKHKKEIVKPKNKSKDQFKDKVNVDNKVEPDSETTYNNKDDNETKIRTEYKFVDNSNCINECTDKTEPGSGTISDNRSGYNSETKTEYKIDDDNKDITEKTANIKVDIETLLETGISNINTNFEMEKMENSILLLSEF